MFITFLEEHILSDTFYLKFTSKNLNLGIDKEINWTSMPIHNPNVSEYDDKGTQHVHVSSSLMYELQVLNTNKIESGWYYR